MTGVRISAPLGFQVEGETKAGRLRLEINWDRLRPSDQVASLGPVTPVDGGGCSTSCSSSGGGGTWGRSSGPPKKDEFEQTLGVSDGKGSLACCSPWGHKVRQD